MSKDAPVDIGSLITATPGVQGGQLCIAGTRMRVLTVASDYREGWTAEEIANDFDLPLSHVYAAITYYLANRSRLDAEIDEEIELYERQANESQTKAR